MPIYEYACHDAGTPLKRSCARTPFPSARLPLSQARETVVRFCHGTIDRRCARPPRRVHAARAATLAGRGLLTELRRPAAIRGVAGRTSRSGPPCRR